MPYNVSVGLTPLEDDMRIECPHCESKVSITGHNKMSPAVKDIYASCNCGWRGVMTLSHKHDIQPPTIQMRSMLQQLIATMPAEERAALLEPVG
ncbi:MAG: ogr/Delta-like zinc finger family protein [Motiliproteus sp.]